MSDHLDNVTELPETSKIDAGDGMHAARQMNPGQTRGTMTSEPEIDRELPDKNMLSAVDARQGVISGRVFLVLLTSVVLAVVALGVVYFLSY
jgi:hypothetical protein